MGWEGGKGEDGKGEDGKGEGMRKEVLPQSELQRGYSDGVVYRAMPLNASLSPKAGPFPVT